MTGPEALARMLAEETVIPAEEWEAVIAAVQRGAKPFAFSPVDVADAAEALDIGQESVDDYADQFSDVDARLDGGVTRATAARMRALAARLRAA